MLENKEDVAKKAIGIGAVIFNELFNTRIKDYAFDWNNVLNFDGETGPYVQYSVARANSIISKNDFNSILKSVDKTKLYLYKANDDEISLIKVMYKLNDILMEAANKYEPSILLTRYITEIANYLINFIILLLSIIKKKQLKNLD